MKKIFLTSTGLSDRKIAKHISSLINNKNRKKIAIVTTAAKNKEKNKYSQLAKKQFEEAGFKNIDFVDLEFNDFSSDKYSIVYVCGGNTFKLLKFAKQRNFDTEIKKLFKNNGIYIGVSAGSIIMTPSIRIADEIETDTNIVQLRNLDAFSFVNFHVLPHFTKRIEKKVKDFENKYHVKVERLTNDQALFISNNVINKIK